MPPSYELPYAAAVSATGTGLLDLGWNAHLSIHKLPSSYCQP